MSVSKIFRDRVSLDTCRSWRIAALLVLLSASTIAPAEGRGTPVALEGAKVLAQRGANVYVLLGDSTEVAPRDTLLLDAGKRRRAAASVVDLAEGGLLVARVVSGSLARERRLDRLRVSLERRALPSLSTLRIGVPSTRRAALHFGCGSWTLRSPVAAPYRIEVVSRVTHRMTRDRSGDSLAADPPPPGARAGAAWPDTILVTLFDDAAEEEIALERADLDVALFGPGELSARLRNDPRWQSRLFADGGALAGSGAADSTAVAASSGYTPFPVLAPPDLVPYVRALGASSLLGLLDCGPARREPR